MDMRYIHDWLEDHYKEINARWENPPRILGKTGIVSVEQHEFQTQGQVLASRLEKAIQQGDPKRHKPFRFVIIKSALHERNAWAISASKCYIILTTQDLIANIQMVCGQVCGLLNHAMSMPSSDGGFLRELWAGMPAENNDFSSYGSLLAQIAFDFIVHHELAHAGLGHEWIIANSQAIEDSAAISEEEREWVLEENYESASALATESNEAWRQPLEADADLNAILYTIQFMDLQGNRFKEMSVQPEDSMGTVWKHFLADNQLKWFTIMAGVSIGLGCLLSEQKDGLGDLSTSSHPPLPARMLLLLHVARQLQKPDSQVSIANVLLLVSALFSMVNTAKGSPTETIDSALGRFNVQEAINRFEEIGKHFVSLALDMRLLAPRRDHLRRFPDFLRWEWYAADAISASSATSPLQSGWGNAPLMETPSPQPT